MSKSRVCVAEPGYAQEDPYSDPGVRHVMEQRCRCCGKPFLRDSLFCCNPCAVRYTMRKRMDNKVQVRTCEVCGALFATHSDRRVACSPACQELHLTGERQRIYRRRHGKLKKHLDVGKFRHRAACGTLGVNLFAATLGEVDCPNCLRSKEYRRLRDATDKAARA